MPKNKPKPQSPVTALLILIVLAFSIALFLRGGEVLTAMAIASENSSQVTITINAVAPVCDGTTVYDADEGTTNVMLVGGSTRFVKCNATCNDHNGWGNMKNFTGNFTNFTSRSCSQSGGTIANNVFCYVNATCKNTSIAGNNTAQRVECSWNLLYNARNTSKSGDWNCTLMVGDVDGLNQISSDTIDVADLLAIGSEATIAFGAKAPNANDSTVSVSDNVFNYGNVEMDFKVNASNFAAPCTAITAEYLKVNTTNGATFLTSWPLTTALSGPHTGSKWDINLTSNLTVTADYPQAPNRTTFWGIGIPGGVGGSCTSYVWFAAQIS